MRFMISFTGGRGTRRGAAAPTALSAPLLRRALDELDLVAVGILHEGNDRRATLDRSGLARHRAAGRADAVAGGGSIRHGDRDVPERASHLIAADAVVVGEL